MNFLFSTKSQGIFSTENERLADAPLIIVRLRLNEAWHQQALIHVFGEKDNERQIQHISYFYRLVPHSQFFISLDLSPLSNDLTPSQNDWNIESSSWKPPKYEPPLKSSIFHQRCLVLGGGTLSVAASFQRVHQSSIAFTIYQFEVIGCIVQYLSVAMGRKLTL